MDDRIGRLDANVGVDRTATEQAACSVSHWPFDARPVRGVPAYVTRSAGTLRTFRGTLRAVCETSLPHSFGGVCFGGAMTADNSPTTMARLCAANVIAGKANDHARERAMVNAAGGVASAILCRSQQV